jgi:hypothetical protein
MVQAKVQEKVQRIERNEERRGFRFSFRTIENLKYLVDMGIARNETEAIDFALEAFASEYRTREKLKHESNEIVIHEGKGQSYRSKEVEDCTLKADALNA